IATIILSALLSVNIYRIGKDVYGQPVGVIAGYSSVVSLPLIFHSWTFYATTLAACLFSFFVIHFLRLIKFDRNRDGIAAGIFLGLSVLTRTEMLIFAPVGLIWFLVVKGIRNEYLGSIFTVLLIAALVILPWTVRNYLVCEKVVLVSSNGGVNFFIGNNPLQRGGYFPPRAMNNKSGNFLLTGLTYDLEHPGWFIHFFKEKGLLYGSSRTWEHPKQLLESRFEKSALRMFNDRFEESRLSGFIRDSRLDPVFDRVNMLYTIVIGVFWLLVTAGIFYSHLFWRESYFLMGIWLTSVVVFSLFFSGANRWFVPILPYLYIIMGSGVVFLYRLPSFKGEEVKKLVWVNGLLVLLLLGVFLSRKLLIYYPETTKETIEELHAWNLISMGEESVRLLIMGSQLSYPVKPDSMTSDSFSVMLEGREIPHISQAGDTPRDEKFYFKDVKEFLCNNGFVINVPHGLMNSFLTDTKGIREKVTGKEIVQSLEGKITVSYVPAWKFRGWVEAGINSLLDRLKGRQAQIYGSNISGHLSSALLKLPTV
ncbi:MAG: glycosyltransferase family 39 protein, partial [Thermodesulfobacteriota bacterium]|nr:glycosyltransferase family 39 protein [Thermodesulfobacteriota bacterium]